MVEFPVAGCIASAGGGLYTRAKSCYSPRPPVRHLSLYRETILRGDSSFPSGHTLEAFAMAAAVSFLFSRRKIIFTAYAWAVVVAYSRMALGVHYPTDVLAGMIIGTLIGWVVPRGFGRGFRIL